MIRIWLSSLQLVELFISSCVHLLYGFYIFSTAITYDLSQNLCEYFKPKRVKYEVKDVSHSRNSSFDDLPPIVLVHGIFGFGQGRLGGLSYFAGAEKKDERVLVPDLGSLTSIYDRWAIVKDKEIAMNMLKVMTLETIGTCHEGQLRATKLLDFVADGYDDQLSDEKPDGFFEFGHGVLAERWEKLRAVVESCGAFSLPDFPSEFCTFWGKHRQPNPAYAWMELKTEGEAAKIMSGLKIRTRCGTRFGVSAKYIRVNMMESDESFNLFLERLSTIKLE